MPSNPRKPRLTEDQQRRFDRARHTFDTCVRTALEEIEQGTDPARAFGEQLGVASHDLGQMLTLVVELTDPVADVDRALAADLDEQTAPLPPHSTDGEPDCEEMDNGYTCNAARGHGGPLHVAYAGADICHTWPTGPNAEG